MGKIRIYELSKEINVPAKDILSYLTEHGVSVTNHMSSIDEETAGKVKGRFRAGNAGQPAGTPPAEKESKDARKAKTNGQAEKQVKKVENNEDKMKENQTQPDSRNGEEQTKKPKKKTISAVFNPQNSRNGNRNQKSIVKGRSSQKQSGHSRKNSQQSQTTGGSKRSQQHSNDKQVTVQRSTRVKLRKPTVKYDTVTTGSATSVDHSTHHSKQAEHNASSENEHKESAAVRNAAETAASSETSKQERTAVRQGGDQHEKKGSKENRKGSVQKSVQNSRDGGNSRSADRHGSANSQGHQKSRKDNKVNHNRPTRNDMAGDVAQGGGHDHNDRSRSRNKKHHNGAYDKKGSPKKQERYVNLEKKTGHKKKNATPTPASKKRDKDEIISIKIPEYLTVHELADRMKIQPSEIIKKLFLEGTVLTMNQEIDYKKAEEIALEFNCICEPEEKVDVIAELLKEEEEDESEMVPRPPVVCVMGHVDHGKTSLLDAIRQTHVTDREAGGITQHIGASVASINGRKITFLDTPGHEAFTAMRMRGANSTDIAILVVAADDGIMPQTIEAINHAKAAGIEIIVAINKIDKPGANIDMVKQGLAEQGLIPEDWGGKTICVPVSAKTHQGVDELLEMVLLTADMLELKANPKKNARGIVIEAKIDKGRGVVATVLVQKGTLKQGEPIAAGSSHGRVRAMTNFKGKRVREAGPSTPVEIIGLNSIPNAGEVFMTFDSEKEARNFAEAFVDSDKEKLLDETRARRNLDNIFSQIQAGDLKELELIVKADVQGSVEAVKESLEKLSNDEVVVKVIHSGVGMISESDVNLASASNAVIIGFNVKTDSVAKNIAEQEHIDIRNYSVIYKAIDDVENAMKGMLEPIYEEQVIGHAEVRQLFKASGVGTIAGSYVLDGYVERDCKIRITRDGDQIYDGGLASLKRYKDDVKQVKAGYECGLVFENFNEIREGDQVEAFKMVEVPRT